MKNEALETIDYKGFEIEIFQDDPHESPRDWDNIGFMACWHRRYELGDIKKRIDPETFCNNLVNENWPKGYILNHVALEYRKPFELGATA